MCVPAIRPAIQCFRGARRRAGLTLPTLPADDPAMSLPSAPSTPRKGPHPLILLLAVILVVVAIVLMLRSGGREALEQAIAFLRAAGPVAFFCAMAVAPLPLAWFTIPAGEAFAANLTLPGVIAAALVAVAVQIALYYWLARYALRPTVERWMVRRGYTVPKLSNDNALAVVLLVRLPPGPPLPLQCLLLGLAEVPFRTYLIASWLITVPWVLGGVILGRGILHGNLMLAAGGVGVIGAAAIAAYLARRRWLSRPA
jgi:uncharacterized membrane protein YdjX (TVP38/TMEM64 family)